MITTVAASQHEILQHIATLYNGGAGFDVDVTYSTGKFYQHGVPEPTRKFDLVPKSPGVEQADCRHLPLDSASVGSLVFDPPFIHAAGKDGIIGNRFADLPYQHNLRALYLGAMVEFYRVLRHKGILIFKCQDIVESGRQVMNHCLIWEMATRLGFLELDLFILTAASRLIGHNHGVQQHARKFHSYFWVFEKGPRR